MQLFSFQKSHGTYQLVSEQIQAQDMLRKSHTSSAIQDKAMFMLALHCFYYLKIIVMEISRQFECSLFWKRLRVS